MKKVNEQNKFTIYLIHHSHTDIGYTDYQEKIEMHHIYYLKEVIDILDEIHSGKTEWKGYKWNCESFWCVEKFLENADDHYRNAFIKYVKSGEIGLSGNYLNLTELVDSYVLNSTLKRCAELMSKYGVTMDSGMTADINGYSWGYSDVLYENGIENLLSCIHTHHGYHPLFKKQTPFYWQTPKGNKVLVWNGDHYLLGNELGIAQQGEFEYTVRDGLGGRNLDKFEKAEKRLETYVRVLREQDHPYDFTTISLSGMMTDNSPTSPKIIEFVNKYNELHGDEIYLQMVTIDEFFRILRATEKEIPTYSGDWTDWWADGVGSTPNTVQHYREALRKLYVANQLDPDKKICGEELIDSAIYNAIFYAEHTWGYSSSVSEPWHPNVNKLDLRKSLFALKANEMASRACDKITFANGETPVSLRKDYGFTAINPHDFAVDDYVRVNMETLFGYEHFEVVEKDSGLVVPYQLGRYARGFEFVILVHLEAKEKKSYYLRKKAAPALNSSGNRARMGADSISDLHSIFNEDLEKGNVITPYYLENKFFKIRYEENKGITSIFDILHKKELIRNNSVFSAFAPIYEVTPVTTNQCDERRRMGRNRKSVSTKRDTGKMISANVIEDGTLYSRVELGYKLDGTNACSLILTAYKDIPRIDVDLRMHKVSVWEPENVYLALPFTTGNENETFWVEKQGAVLRPRVDQLPGTCTDFYAIHNGMCYQSENSTVVIATPDTPLISMGKIEAHEIKLSGESGVNNIDDVYAWVMNNFWETNFKVDLGGFHQYRYSLLLGDTLKAEDSINLAKAANCPVLSFHEFK